MKTYDFPVEFLNWYLETIHRRPIRPANVDDLPSRVLNVPSYEPTQEQIARECARIRANWPPGEALRRQSGMDLMERMAQKGPGARY